MQASGLAICERCYCCEVIHEEVPCWSCGGFEPDYEDEWDDGWCDACQGELTISFLSCLGNCDENGKHEERKP